MNIFLLTAMVLACYMLLLFILAITKRDNSIVDIGYGLAFIVITWTAFLNQNVTPSQRSLLVTVFITLWGIRLAYRIARKNWGKPEDFRYAAWRVEWQKKGQLYFLLRSFFQVFALQGVIIYMVVMPGILGNTMQIDTLRWYNIVGVLIWVVGFLFEAIGDYQLDRFLKLKKIGKIKANIMKIGLWKYTRHPNYFGESMQWWGLALLCLAGVEHSLYVLISPLLITYLLVHVSGIPLLEKRWKGDPEWEAYAKKTNSFIPGTSKT